MRAVRQLPIVLLATCLALPAPATSVVRQTFESLTDTSDVVVRGLVDHVELRAIPGEPPFRLAYVRVTETAAGAPPGIVPVRIPGGVGADGRRCAVAGTPEFAAGDEVVLFLMRVPAESTGRPTVAPPAREPSSDAVRAGGAQPAAQWQPVALGLGTWRVVGQGADRRVVPDPSAAHLRQVGETAGAAMPPSVPVADLLRRVRERRQGGAR